MRRRQRLSAAPRLRVLGATVACCMTLVWSAAATADASAAARPRLSVTAAILIEQSTGQRLYGDGIDRELPIASTTKLMTALVTLQHEHNLSKIFTQPDYVAAPSDSQIGLAPGERMSVHDLMLALMLPSADDAAEDLAYNVGHRSVGRFIAMMNREARRLGLKHTHYATPIGLDTSGNYSSAADLVKLASYDLTHSPYFKRIVALPHAVLRSGAHVRYVVNRNDLVAEHPWIDGVKTGHTADAGYVLVASGHRRGMTLISAVLGTSSEASRDANTIALLDYGFANFHLVKPVRAGEVLARPAVRYRSGRPATLIAAAPFTRVVDDHAHVRVVVHAPHQLTGPLARGARLGTAVVLVDGRPVAHVPLRLASALPAISPLTSAAHFITRPLTLALLVIAIGGATALAFLLRRRRRARAAEGGLEAA